MVSRPRADTRSLRHWGGFVFSGGVAFLIDAGITTGLVRFARLDPYSARFIAILIAMVAAWLMHRRITFDVAGPPSVKEFLRFAAVAWTANALNYGIYVVDPARMARTSARWWRSLPARRSRRSFPISASASAFSASRRPRSDTAPAAIRPGRISPNPVEHCAARG